MRVLEDVLKYEPAPRTWAHLDVADGSASSVMRWHHPNDLHHLDTTLNLELHLMEHVDEARFLAWCNHHVRRIYVHLEFIESWPKLFALARERRVQLGLALFRETPIETVLPYLQEAAGVLLLAVTPGMSGEEIDLSMLERVRQLRAAHAHIPITLDGGVRVGIAQQAIRAGATRLIAGSAIFTSPNPQDAYQRLVHDAENATQ